MFLSFDGIDGTGKSTQCRLLVEWLRAEGYEVVHCVEPGTTPIGEKIRGLLLSKSEEMTLCTEAMLFMASRAELVEKVIQPAIDEGRIVVSDRYLLSTIVYQGFGGGLNLDMLREIGKFVTRGIMPDVAFVLDLPTEKARERFSTNPDRMESRPLSYYDRVRRGFLSESKSDPKRYRVIDASPSIEAIQGTIRGIVAKLLEAQG